MGVVECMPVLARVVLKSAPRLCLIHFIEHFELAGSSVCSSAHLQFHRSPGWCFSQKGWPTGSVSFFCQYCRWEFSGSGDVVGIQRSLGRMSLSRSACRQSAAAWARSRKKELRLNAVVPSSKLCSVFAKASVQRPINACLLYGERWLNVDAKWDTAAFG